MNKEKMEFPVKILKTRFISDMEDLLNQHFKLGYHISGGITVDGESVYAVVIKPF